MRRWIVAGLVAGGFTVGCASPGPPKAPSLQLPEPVADLTAARAGDQVELSFTWPQRTTDNLPIRESGMKMTICRAIEGGPCTAVPSLQNVLVSPDKETAAERVTEVDGLPAPESTGEPRLLVYRIEFSNLEGKSAGWSDPAYAAAGTAPVPVDDLQAQETRAGILLRWKPTASSKDEVLLRRELVSPPAKAKHEETEPVWLESHANAGETIDGSVSEDTPYRYAAVRRRVVQLGDRKVELRSKLSKAVAITWKNASPPPAPLRLSAAPFAQGGGFSVDLVWEPVQEPGLKGYVVTRQALDATGAIVGSPENLTPQPVALPAFHDASAKQGVAYRYAVRAVSKKGMEGGEATIVVGR